MAKKKPPAQEESEFELIPIESEEATKPQTKPVSAKGRREQAAAEAIAVEAFLREKKAKEAAAAPTTPEAAVAPPEAKAAVTPKPKAAGRPRKPVLAPTPVREVTPTPVREVTPTPVREVTPTPVREVTPTPVREVTPTPVREVTPTPVREVTPTPVREVTPTPMPPGVQETKKRRPNRHAPKLQKITPLKEREIRSDSKSIQRGRPLKNELPVGVYCERSIEHSSHFDPDSFRYRRKNSKTWEVVGCPKDQFHPKSHKCRVALRVHRLVMAPKHSKPINPQLCKIDSDCPGGVKGAHACVEDPKMNGQGVCKIVKCMPEMRRTRR